MVLSEGTDVPKNYPPLRTIPSVLKDEMARSSPAPPALSYLLIPSSTAYTILSASLMSFVPYSHSVVMHYLTDLEIEDKEIPRPGSVGGGTEEPSQRAHDPRAHAYNH